MKSLKMPLHAYDTMILMNKTHEINWNSFKAKFNGKEQKEFERLSYILFCLEHGEKYGIFRYKNQAGIETNPIEIDGIIIGFQTKFYETKISDNIADIKDSIEKAKNKNPNLNKILFYLNQEFSESSDKTKQKPKYQKDVENHAKGLGIEIDWRVPSHFERQLIEQHNHWLYEIFFSLNKGLCDFLYEIESHTKNHLNAIRSSIFYNNQYIKFDRKELIENIKSNFSKTSTIIINGSGGVGKTAVIKDLFAEINCPFFIFKAFEFNNKTNINELFSPFGAYTYSDFIKAYEDDDLKIIVIDSAEKMSDIENTEVFRIFIKSLIKEGWKIIFTTREMYLNDLTFELQNSYGINAIVLNITVLTIDELTKISKEHSFDLPSNEKFEELLTIPFYLSEYLSSYTGNQISLKDFKDNLWKQQIMKSALKKDNIHIRRERAFQDLIETKVSQNNFFIYLTNPDDEALAALCQDEIIKYDESKYAYFITHDIYEEWGLEKFIDYKFAIKTDNNNFISSIGNSLQIRRSFRNWLSNKLYENQKDIKEFINQLISDDNIQSYWKDEIFVSVLLSDYSGTFFELFKDKLLENEQALLLRVIFMLRIACKGLDYEFMQTLLIDSKKWMNMAYVLTVPKGRGWENTIKFIYENIEKIDSKNMNNIISLLNDWISKNKCGVTTKYSGKISLFYFEKLELYRDERKKLITLITNSAYEIKEELEKIIDKILINDHHDKYEDIASEILKSPLENATIIKLLPEKIFSLARKDWLYQKNDDGMFENIHHNDVEYDFGLNSHSHNDYYPASAFQTPIVLLLQPNNFYKTLNFIVSFINETTEIYANSRIGIQEGVSKVRVFVGDKVVEQYASGRLWQTYRGTGVSPHLLESMLMALERMLLNIAETHELDIIEPILFKLLLASNSVSLSAVVASIVIAYPDKLYNVAKILFKTKEFFKFDLVRKLQDSTHQGIYGISSKKIYVDERKSSNKLEHRKKSLEDIALYYQILKKENSITDIETRRKELCEIWDNYTTNLPSSENQTEDDISLRFALARMDYRNLEAEIVSQNKEKNEIQIAFKSKPDEALDTQRKLHEEKVAEDMKYVNSGLWLWVNKKYSNEDIDENNYDKNPHLAFDEMKEMIEKEDKTERFILFHRSLPSYISTVLIRDFSEQLSIEEKDYCKNIMLQYASLPLHQDYYFQYSDGTEPAIKHLNDLVKIFPNEKETIRLLLVHLMLKSDEINKYAASCILNLWNIDFELSQNIWLTYLKFKPAYDEISKKVWTLSYKNEDDKIQNMYEKFHKKIKASNNKKLSYSKFKNIEKNSLEILNIAFQLLPNGSDNPDHKNFCIKAISVFADSIYNKNRENKYDLYKPISEFSRKLAYYILKLPKNEIECYLKPLIEKFNSCEDFANLLVEFSVAEDVLQEYDNFWHIWSLFYEKIKNMLNDNNKNYYCKEIITDYLLAGHIMCRDTAKEWHSLKKENLDFYYRVAKDMGQFEHVLYSIAKVSNYLSSSYLEENFEILSYCIETHNYSGKEISTNNIYYIENIVRRFILHNKQKIKTNIALKNKTIKILNFLIDNASVYAYMLRENII